MTGIAIRIDGDTEALGILNRAEAALEQPRDLYEDLGLLLTASVQENFDAESDPEGSPWPRSLRAQFEGGKTLTDTAALKNSITHEAGDDSVSVGTNSIYGAIHQFGGVIRAKTSKGLRFRGLGNGGWVTKQSVTIPARAFLGIGPEDEKEVIGTTENWLSGKFGGLADAHR